MLKRCWKGQKAARQIIGGQLEAVKKYIFDSLSMKICDFHRICIHAARTHFVRTLAWIAVFLHRNEFGTKIDLILFRPFGRNFTRFFDTLKLPAE